MKKIAILLLLISVANCSNTIKTDTSCDKEKMSNLERFIKENPEADVAQLFLQAMKENCEKENHDNNSTKESK